MIRPVNAEWIGSKLAVVSAENKALVGIRGLVVDETKNLLVVETSRGEKRVPKHGSVFRITLGGRDFEVMGDDILSSPEERIKLKVK